MIRNKTLPEGRALRDELDSPFWPGRVYSSTFGHVGKGDIQPPACLCRRGDVASANLAVAG
jgi:hypothetical protein